MRTVLLAAAGAGVVSTVAVVGIAGGSAGAAPAGGRGNNGTVKIHDGFNEPAPETRNEPRVCTFDVHEFHLDADQGATFAVRTWPPTGDREVVLSGKITADGSGTGRAPAARAYSLPEGHYKLTVDTGEGKPIRDKHKVFRVDCRAKPSGAPTASHTGRHPARTHPSRKPTTPCPTPTHRSGPPVHKSGPPVHKSGPPAHKSRPPAHPAPSPSGSPNVPGPPPGAPRDLPTTGWPVAAIAGIGLALMLGGVGLLAGPRTRRRLLRHRLTHRG